MLRATTRLLLRRGGSRTTRRLTPLRVLWTRPVSSIANHRSQTVSGSRSSLAGRSTVNCRVNTSCGSQRWFASDAAQVEAEESHSFGAEVGRILEIVTHSLYTDREVFLRELISNASDALEKQRYLRTLSSEAEGADDELEIRVESDEDGKVLKITDTGVGMTKSELMAHLGTIAKSGSRAFLQEQQKQAQQGEQGGGGSKDASNIIGQFGVGFYSAFMVAERVEVITKRTEPVVGEDGKPSSDGVGVAYHWESDGTGAYKIAKLADSDSVPRGTQIILHLREDAKEFAGKYKVEQIVRKYSHFVGFPIMINGEKINTVGALWASSQPSSITEEQHTEFYRYVANAFDEPLYRMHLNTDVPIQISALFYFPSTHLEKFGQARMDPGVSLYSRKVLIQPKCPTILPDWLRFVKGVVDSEDIPLNISRETMQDSLLITRINRVLTKRVIKHLEKQAKEDSDKYSKQFFGEFGNFLKEGVCTDFEHKNDIAKLLRFESSVEEGRLTSLDEYVSQMAPEQQNIYYLSAPNRQYALSSPYFEAFKQRGVEVLFMHQTIDEFVMKNLGEYSGRKLLSIESADAHKDIAAMSKTALSKDEGKDGDKDKADEEDGASESDSKNETKKLDEKQGAEIASWFQTTLSDRVSSVAVSDLLVSFPAVVVGHESASMRRVMQFVDQNMGNQLPKQKLELNVAHPVVVQLFELRHSKPELAKLVAEQIFDNALIAADLLDSPRSMLARLNSIMEQATLSE